MARSSYTFFVACLVAMCATSTWSQTAMVGRATTKTSAPATAAAADERWLAVWLNGQPTDVTALVRYDHSGNLWVGEQELRSWRLTTPDEVDLSVPGFTLFPLKAFDGLTFRVDDTNQTLTIEAPARLFERVQVPVSAPVRASLSPTPPGGLFNYDVVATRGSEGIYASTLLEAGTFGRLGTGVTRFIARKRPEQMQSIRLDSTWTSDRPDKLTSLRIGDSVTSSGGSWGGAVRFGGVQLASNFSMQPGLVTMPLQSVAGESALPSTLELYVNDTLRMRQEMPGGPFTLRDVPVMSGDGEIRVVVRDMLGREQVITQGYYSSPRLLREGLHDFSIEAGAVRENFGLASNDYGRLLISGTERYGFTDRVTGEVHAELLKEQQTLGASAGLLITEAGVLSLTLAGSRAAHGTGHLAALGFERTSSRFSLGLSGEMASEGFTRLGFQPDERTSRFKAQVFANLSLGNAGSVSWMSARQQFHGGGIVDVSNLRYSFDVRGLGYFSASATRFGGEEQDLSFSLLFARSVGKLGSTSVGLSSNERGLSGYTQMQRGVPAGRGFGYRLRARGGDVQAEEAGVSYQSDAGTYMLEAQHADGDVQTRASLSGGLALMQGHFFASRRIDNSFAIAQVGSEPNVRIYRDNQLVARTNEKGFAILPGLRPYEENQISIEQADLPLDVSVGALRENAVPAFRSGMLVSFAIERARGGLLTVKLENGQDLPAGSIVTVLGQPGSFPTGMRGEVYISQLAAQNRLRASWPQGTCEFDVAYAPTTDPLPQLGPFECRAVSP